MKLTPMLTKSGELVGLRLAPETPSESFVLSTFYKQHEGKKCDMDVAGFYAPEYGVVFNATTATASTTDELHEHQQETTEPKS